jgi:hypothetical protein
MTVKIAAFRHRTEEREHFRRRIAYRFEVAGSPLFGAALCAELDHGNAGKKKNG